MTPRLKLLAVSFSLAIVSAVLFAFGEPILRHVQLLRIGCSMGQLDPAREDVRRRAYLLAEAHDFDGLDAMATELRTKRTRDGQGEWLLPHFYTGVFDRIGDECDQGAADALLFIPSWLTARPRSAAAHVVTVEGYVNQAWSHRGSGWASDVTPEGWQGFRTALDKGWKLFQEAQALDEQDPQLYAVAMQLCLGMNQPPEVADAIIERCRTLAPDYAPLFRARVSRFLHRWGGDDDDLASFAESAADELGGDDGDVLYARLAQSVFRYVGVEEMLSYRFNVTRVLRGFAQVSRTHPTSTEAVSRLGFYAWLFDRRDTARDAFTVLGPVFDAAPWSKNYALFADVRAWALGEAEQRPSFHELASERGED